MHVYQSVWPNTKVTFGGARKRLRERTKRRWRVSSSMEDGMDIGGTNHGCEGWFDDAIHLESPERDWPALVASVNWSHVVHFITQVPVDYQFSGRSSQWPYLGSLDRDISPTWTNGDNG